MILKGSQRGGAQQLAVHLLRLDENDHVDLHEVRGFVARNLRGALSEAYAISKGTRCQQFLLSLSLNPPESEQVPIIVFEEAVEAIEGKLGLRGQPRVVVFHEKNGRRHAHCVWSRIDAERMRAINLPHFKLKLRDMSRELYIEHGWHMPLGLVNSAERDPCNFTRAEWQQAKRTDHDPATLKGTFQDCWAISDSRKAFAQALAARGLYLARGDRRGFVAVDIKGEVFAIARWAGVKTKEVEARLGDPIDLPSVADTKVKIADLLKGVLGRELAEADAAYRTRRAPVLQKQAELRATQRERRAALRAEHARRAAEEAQLRAGRFRRGLRGLWDRLTGRHARIKKENEAEAVTASHFSGAEVEALIQSQLRERRLIASEMSVIRRGFDTEMASIQDELAELDGSPSVIRPEGRGASGTGPRRRDQRGPQL